MIYIHLDESPFFANFHVVNIILFVAKSIPSSVYDGYILLDSFRRIVQMHMTPVEHLFLLNPFDEAMSSHELASSLGKQR